MSIGKNSLVFFFLFVVAILAAIPAVAQDDQTLRVDVELVYVAVDAYDMQGQPIIGLSNVDFRIVHNDIEVPVRGLEAVPNDIEKDGPVAVALVLCNKGCIQEEELKQAAHTLLKLFESRDLVALYIATPRPTRLSDFTNDFAALEALVSRIQIVREMEVPFAETLFMASDDLIALMGDRKKVLALVSGDALDFSAERLVMLQNTLVEHKIPFWNIDTMYEPQRILAENTGGVSNNVHNMSVENAGEVRAALDEFRKKIIPGVRYLLAFSPVVPFVNPLGQTIDVTLSPNHGVPGRDYRLVIQKVLVRSTTKEP